MPDIKIESKRNYSAHVTTSNRTHKYKKTQNCHTNLKTERYLTWQHLCLIAHFQSLVTTWKIKSIPNLTCILKPRSNSGRDVKWQTPVLVAYLHNKSLSHTIASAYTHMCGHTWPPLQSLHSCCSIAPPSVEQEVHDGALLDMRI